MCSVPIRQLRRFYPNKEVKSNILMVCCSFVIELKVSGIGPFSANSSGLNCQTLCQMSMQAFGMGAGPFVNFS